MNRAAREENRTVAAENADDAIRRLSREIAMLADEVRRLKRQSLSDAALNERDDLIRKLRADYDKSSANGAATALLKEWQKYLSKEWLRERKLATLPKASAHRRALHRISKINRGAALSIRHLTNIFDGLRNS